MCGRFALALPADELEQLPGYPALRPRDWVHRERYVPRYNVAPRTHAPVLRRARPDAPDLVLHSMRWGLVPHWSRTPDPPALNTINARAEAVVDAGGGMWGSVRGRKRCVVVAQGYYEWLKRGAQRVPYFTRHKDGRLMLFAGLYDRATPEGETKPLWTFTIVTTAASRASAWLHDRQPVILTSPAALARWLDTSSETWDTTLAALLEPHNDAAAPLECYAVPAEVGKVGTESPAFVEPVEKRRDGIEALFARQAAQPSPRPHPRASAPTSRSRPRIRVDDPVKVEPITIENDSSEERSDGGREAVPERDGTKCAPGAPAEVAPPAATDDVAAAARIDVPDEDEDEVVELAAGPAPAREVSAQTAGPEPTPEPGGSGPPPPAPRRAPSPIDADADADADDSTSASSSDIELLSPPPPPVRPAHSLPARDNGPRQRTPKTHARRRVPPASAEKGLGPPDTVPRKKPKRDRPRGASGAPGKITSFFRKV
ncbi:hypothetical protein BC834DRAFT_967456 [Gloeopeniophorella convolvens]|nr:hypothetical protein BC834DRAFT_967456 [Gloeopeniophorella convolvens]